MEDPALAMATAEEHIEQIRKKKFSIGTGKNPLRKDLRMAVKYLSTELYSKDVHFLMELIQNAEDNEYPEGVEPSLEFLITSQDITATGASATLLIFNNEKGFSRKNIESICSVGDSTKAGNRKSGYIGEKGIGFKSVFLLTVHPYIFSNGYRIRFSETPCPECDIAYIVPEWVESRPSVSDIQKIYGQSRTLPTTTLILPLKPDKVQAVKEQLSRLHPELLLFLSKIKRLSVKEENTNPNQNIIRAVSISSEIDFVSKKNIDADSYTVHLCAKEDGNEVDEGECHYHMWRQRFPVKEENKVEKRKDIEEWAITLAFPYGKRLNRGMSSPGIYAFLPTEAVTNLPFIIQADFLLPSSRETILWDDVWNQGILSCVPDAFINEFVSLIRTREDAPVSSLASMFSFLPINQSGYPKLEAVRETIKQKLLRENIIPSESHSDQKFFYKPGEVGRLMPSFWEILLKAKSQGAKLHNLSSQGKHILSSSFDLNKYSKVLNFLGIQFVDNEWYPKCIQSCNLVSGVGEDVYKELLHFVSEYWNSNFMGTSMKSIPLLKYADGSGNISLFSINDAKSHYYTLCRSLDERYISWLIDWSKEFRSATQLYFLPEKTQKLCSGHTLHVWLRDCVAVQTLSVNEYASRIHKSLNNNRTMVLAFAHFLYLSHSKGYLSKSEAKKLCLEMPVLEAYGGVSSGLKRVLVPADGSKWVELMGSNPWRCKGYIELAGDYLHSGRYAGQYVHDKVLIDFLQICAGASDIPDLCPPDAAFATVSGPLTKQNAFLLLDWIKKLRSKGMIIPNSFLSCIKNGSWLKVTMSGFSAYKPPSQSFILDSSWGSLLQSGSDMVDIPLVDEAFYDHRIRHYEGELKVIGVMSKSGQACEFIAKNLMSLAASGNLTRSKVLAMLNFIKFLRDEYLPVNAFINGVKTFKWVQTSCGVKSPLDSVLYDASWEAALSISQIPFLDQDYYGNDDILAYKTELNLLGVMVGFKENYQTIIDHLKPSASLNCLTAEPLIFALKCIRNCSSSGKLVAALKVAKCLRTNSGYLSPGECFLFDQEWGCILEVLEGFPLVDVDFYGGEILKYKTELKKIGLVVDFDVAAKAFSDKFKRQASSNLINEENALALLSAYRKLSKAGRLIPAELLACVRETKWLKTRLGVCMSPKDCILFGPDWQPISLITLLPFIDFSDYKDELKSMGVVVDFTKGADIVLSRVFFPQDPAVIAPFSIISLLQCIRNSKPGGEKTLPETFMKQIHQTKWLKTTTFGYLSPKECLLFDEKRKCSLQPQDGPFLDEEYYGQPLSSFKNELATIGVTVDLSSKDANSLLANHLKSFSEFGRIKRIYDSLNESGWKPVDESHQWIWIPSSSTDGMWVSPQECCLHDDKGLFSSRLHVLDRNYKPKLLFFFSKAFGVRSKPSLDDYCMLWKDWENSRPVLLHEECCAFWGYVVQHWNSKTEEVISKGVAKIPAVSGRSADIVLLNKQDVFLPDDLLLKELFVKSSSRALFVWFPMTDMPLIPRAILFNKYSNIGVRAISGSVTISELSDLKGGELKQVKPKDGYIVKGLAMLILGALADPVLRIDVKCRHEMVKRLLDVSVFEMQKPVMMSYNLKVTSGDIIEVSTCQMVRWERDSSEFYVQKLDKTGRRKNVVEYATKFAQVVSEGLLWEKEDQIPRLSELIKFGFLMDFEEDAVDYFLKSKNLQIFGEDEEFLTSFFSSC